MHASYCILHVLIADLYKVQVRTYIFTLNCPIKPRWLISDKERSIGESKLLNIPRVYNHIVLQWREQSFSFRATIFGLVNQTICLYWQKSSGGLESWGGIIYGLVRSLFEEDAVSVPVFKLIAWQINNAISVLAFICSWSFCRSEAILRRRACKWHMYFRLNIHGERWTKNTANLHAFDISWPFVLEYIQLITRNHIKLKIHELSPSWAW